MKNTTKQWKQGLRLCTAIAFAAVMVFAFAACDMGSGGGNGGDGSETLGIETLTITNQQVYRMVGIGDFQQYNGSGSVTGIGINNSFLTSNVGNISGGKLSFTINKPTQLISIESYFGNLLGEGYSNITANPGNTQGAGIDRFYTNISGFSHMNKFSGSWTGSGFIVGDVLYIYVENDAHITANGSTGQNEQGETYVNTDINLNLKQGWNAVHRKLSVEGVRTSTYTLGNPNSAYWSLQTE